MKTKFSSLTSPATWSMRKKIIVIILGATILFFLNFFQNGIKNFFYSSSLPLQKFISGIGNSVSQTYQTVFMKNKLETENEELRKKMEELLAKNVELTNLENENKILREALRADPGRKFEVFISEATSKNIAKNDSIFIKGGAQDGIRADYPVITPQNVLVGRVNRVYDNFSEVVLISAKDFAFDIKIPRDEGPIYGIVRGLGGLDIELDNVQIQSDIKEKDVLITAVLGGIFPEGLLVGEIEKVKKGDAEPFQQADISPFFVPNDLKKLFIITKW